MREQYAQSLLACFLVLNPPEGKVSQSCVPPPGPRCPTKTHVPADLFTPTPWPWNKRKKRLVGSGDVPFCLLLLQLDALHEWLGRVDLDLRVGGGQETTLKTSRFHLDEPGRETTWPEDPIHAMAIGVIPRGSEAEKKIPVAQLA